MVLKKKFSRSLFSKPKSKRIARAISITSPTAFRRSIRTLKKSNGRLSLKERQGLVLAKNRAGAQLQRKNLSPKERRQFRAITKIRIPKLRKRR